MDTADTPLSTEYIHRLLTVCRAPDVTDIPNEEATIRARGAETLGIAIENSPGSADDDVVKAMIALTQEGDQDVSLAVADGLSRYSVQTPSSLSGHQDVLEELVATVDLGIAPRCRLIETMTHLQPGT